MHTFRIIAAVVLGIVAFAVIVGNWELALASIFRGRRGSMVPLVGGVAGACAVALFPWRFATWWPVPLVLDLGTGGLVIGWLLTPQRRPPRPPR